MSFLKAVRKKEAYHMQGNNKNQNFSSETMKAEDNGTIFEVLKEKELST